MDDWNCGRNLAGDVLRVKGVDHVLQRDDEAFAGAVRIKVVVVLFDGDKPKPDLRKDPFQIGSSLDVVTPEPAEITNYKALDPAGADVVHQPVELRSIKNRSCSSVVHIGIYQIQVGTLCNVGLANLNLICDDIHLFVSKLSRSPAFSLRKYPDIYLSLYHILVLYLAYSIYF